MAQITCIMNVFIRPEYFKEQLDAILNQTIPPKQIIVWNNNASVNVEDMTKGYQNIIVITTSRNLGVWSRFFSMYYLLSGDYVCVFDDDTIPQPKWFENCVKTINTYNALVGTVGIVFKNTDSYSCESKSGWCFPSENIDIVDIVGHSWFFRKEWIQTFIKDLPNLDEKFLTCGEDMHLSYTLSKYMYIPTIVAPHPSNDTSVWGADKKKSLEYGNIKSTWISTGIQKFSDALNFYKKNGFETIMYKNDNIKNYSKCLLFFINKIKLKQPFSLLRFADGEKYVLDNETLTNIDNWTFTSNSILSKHLNDALSLFRTNVFFGISGLSDCEKTCNYYYSKIKNTHNITYANIFVNHNYKVWTDFLNSYNEDCILIACRNGMNNKIGELNITEFIQIDEFLVNKWDSQYETYFKSMEKLGKKYNNTLFLISAGPISEVFIHKLYESNPNNIYIDVGSSIDLLLKGKVTRDYQINDYTNNVLDLPVILNHKL